MVASLGVVALALRAGLRLRRARFGREPRTPDLRRAHLRFAKPAIALIGVGFLSGPDFRGLAPGLDAVRDLPRLARHSRGRPVSRGCHISGGAWSNAAVALSTRMRFSRVSPCSRPRLRSWRAWCCFPESLGRIFGASIFGTSI